MKKVSKFTEEVKSVVLDVMGVIIDEKSERFIEEYHQDRMAKTKLKYPNHYSQMTEEELTSAERKERELVDEYFIENNTSTYLTDGMPFDCIEVIEKYAVELFEDNPPDYNLLKERIDTIYELVATYFSLLNDGYNMQCNFVDNLKRHDEGDLSRREKGIQKRIMELKEISGVGIMDSPLHNELAKIFEALETSDFYKNPNKYIIPKYNLLQPSLKKDYRKYLLEYLNNLPLKNKQKIIPKFISELTSTYKDCRA